MINLVGDWMNEYDDSPTPLWRDIIKIVLTAPVVVIALGYVLMLLTSRGD